MCVVWSRRRGHAGGVTTRRTRSEFPVFERSVCPTFAANSPQSSGAHGACCGAHSACLVDNERSVCRVVESPRARRRRDHTAHTERVCCGVCVLFGGHTCPRIRTHTEQPNQTAGMIASESEPLRNRKPRDARRTTARPRAKTRQRSGEATRGGARRAGPRRASRQPCGDKWRGRGASARPRSRISRCACAHTCARCMSDFAVKWCFSWY